MTTNCKTPFRKWAPVYIDRGLSPRPCVGKACKQKGWQKPDSDLTEGLIEAWMNKYPKSNIGLLMGTKLEDATHLGALDIDNDNYAALGKAVLHNPPCGRIGKKGAVYFVRFTPELFQQFIDKNKRYHPGKFTVSGEHDSQLGQVAEFLIYRQLCVIPPSIHPDTKQRYQWLGKPLHEMDFTQLPLIGA